MAVAVSERAAIHIHTDAAAAAAAAAAAVQKPVSAPRRDYGTHNNE